MLWPTPLKDIHFQGLYIRNQLLPILSKNYNAWKYNDDDDEESLWKCAVKVGAEWEGAAVGEKLLKTKMSL